MELPRPKVLVSILEDHFFELDALWDAREAQVFDPLLDLDDLDEIERRAFAHLTGLRVGQGHTADLAFAALDGDDRSAATAGVFALLGLGVPGLAQQVVTRMEKADPEACDGIRIGLRHHAIEAVEPALRTLAGGDADVARACALDVLAFHRRDPVAGAEALVTHEDPLVRRLAIGSLGRWGGAWSGPQLEAALADDESEVRQEALAAAARTGLPELLPICRAATAVPEALAFLGLLDGAAAVPTLEALLGDDSLASGALAGLGATGSTAALPPLLDALDDVARIHAAGLAFIRITGQSEIRPNAPVDPPEGLEEIEIDLWDPHPEVDPTKARVWWTENDAKLDASRRWQFGLDVSDGLESPHVDALTLEARRGVHLAARWNDPRQAPDLELEQAVYLQRA